MADLAFPTGAVLGSWAMSIDTDGLERRKSRFTGKQSVTIHAPGKWRGAFTINLVDQRDRATAPDVAARINAWVAALVAGLSSDVPFPPTTPTIPTVPSSFTVTDVNADNELTLSASRTFRDGDFFKAGDRVYQVRQPALGPGMMTDAVTVVPYGQSLRRSDLVGSEIAPADVIQVVAAEDVAVSEDPSFAGPWVVAWEELVE